MDDKLLAQQTAHLRTIKNLLWWFFLWLPLIVAALFAVVMLTVRLAEDATTVPAQSGYGDTNCPGGVDNDPARYFC